MRRELLLAAGGLALLFVASQARARTADPGDDEEAGAVDPGPSLDSLFAADVPDNVNADANVSAFLYTIRKSEGTADADGYRRIVGGQLFESFADHPRIKVPFTQTDGVVAYSSAAGAYQFLASTWDGLVKKLGLEDFSPANQDAGAIELVRERGALGLVQQGDFSGAIAKCATIWASLPGSPYPQRTRTPEFVLAAYQQAGGILA